MHRARPGFGLMPLRRNNPASFPVTRLLVLALLWAMALGGATNLETLLPRIAEMIQSGQLTQATELLKSALAEFPNDPRLHNFRGVMAARRSDFDAAEEAFQNAIALAPEFLGAYLNLGRLYQERSGADPAASDKALETYQKLLSFAPRNEQAHYQIAALQLHKRGFAAALEHLSSLPAESQGRAMVLALRCAALAGIGKPEEAERVARELIAAPDFTDLDVLAILPVLESQSHTGLAVMLLEALSGQNKASPEILYRLGLLQKNQGHLDRARATLEQAFRHRPKEAAFLVDLAQIAFDQRDFKGALGYLAHARDLEPENAGIHFFFGMVCVQLDLPLDAKDSLQKAVNLAPDRPYFNYALGAVLLIDRDPAVSINYFKKFAELRPDDPRGAFGMGLAYYYSGRPDEAKTELEKVVAHPETTAGANYYLGRIAMQTHENAAAVDYLRKAIEANPAYAEAYSDLGLAYTRLKQFDLAGKALHRAVELEPEGYRPNLNLLFFYQRTKDERAEAQRQKFDQIKEVRSEQAQLLLRRVEVRPPE